MHGRARFNFAACALFQYPIEDAAISFQSDNAVLASIFFQSDLAVLAFYTFFLQLNICCLEFVVKYRNLQQVWISVLWIIEY